MVITLIKFGILLAAVICLLILYWLVTTDVERNLDEEEKELFGD